MRRSTIPTELSDSPKSVEQLVSSVAALEEQFTRPATDEAGLLEVFRQALESLGLNGVLVFLNEDGRSYHVKAIVSSYSEPSTSDTFASFVTRIEGQRLPCPERSSFRRLISTGEPIFLLDGSGFLRAESLQSREELGVAGTALRLLFTGPSVYVPLQVNGESIGVAGYASRFLNEKSTEPLSTLTAHLSEALAAQSTSRPRQSRRPEGGIDAYSSPVEVSPAGVRQTLESILLDLEKPVPFRWAAIYLQEEGQSRPLALIDRVAETESVERTTSIPDEIVETLKSGSGPIFLPKPPDTTHSGQYETSKRTGAWLGVPLIAREQILGYLTIESQPPRLFGEDEATIAQAVANQAATTIENIRLAEETLRLLRHSQRQAVRMQLLLDLVPDGILLLGEENRVIMHNQSGGRYLAQLTEASAGEKLVVLGEERLERFFAEKGEWIEVKSRGQRHIFEISARPMSTNQGSREWLLFIRNVTDERNRQRYMQAQDRLSTVGQLAAGIAHDFNNMLAVISLYSQLVSRVPDLAENDRRRLSKVQQEAERAASLLTRILDFSRQSIVELKPIEISTFLKELGESLPRTKAEGIEINVAYQGESRHINGDATRLRQVFQNLTENAIEAMPEGGRLQITAAPLTLRPTDPIPLPDLSAGRWIKIEVSDSGPGINSDDLPRVFEPFYSTKDFGQGAGLGLAQVYGIVKQHGGSIDVSSHLGLGTTFTIYLPQAEHVQKPGEKFRTTFEDMGDGETILLVEDDPPTREALAEIIAALNYRVLAARDGEEALQHYERGEKIDLVISDMVMPVMGGASLYAALKEKHPGIRMILVTGYPIDEQLGGVANEGISAFIQKPLRIDEIAKAMRNALIQS